MVPRSRREGSGWAGAWLVGTCRHPLCSQESESKAGAETEEQEEVQLREAKLGGRWAQV